MGSLRSNRLSDSAILAQFAAASSEAGSGNGGLLGDMYSGIYTFMEHGHNPDFRTQLTLWPSWSVPGFNAEGVAAQSPGLTALFAVNPGWVLIGMSTLKGLRNPG
jgi:hypothetical protein